jgi:YesN/AraC family two-component response regulator
MNNIITREEMISFIDISLGKIMEVVRMHYSEKRCNKYVVYIKEYIKSNYSKDISFFTAFKELESCQQLLKQCFQKRNRHKFCKLSDQIQNGKAKELLRTNTISCL